MRPAQWYDERDIDVRPGAWVTGLELDTHELTLREGKPVRYDRLLLATGASARRRRNS